MNVYLLTFSGLLYIVFSVCLMNKYRREELKENNAWRGKSGIEREMAVFVEIIFTPFILIISLISKASKVSNEKKTEDS